MKKKSRVKRAKTNRGRPAGGGFFRNAKSEIAPETFRRMEMGEILFRARFGQLISQEALHIFELFRRAVVSETEATLLANPSEIRRRLEAINTRPANTSEREWLANEKLRIDTCKNLKKTLAEGNGVTP